MALITTADLNSKIQKQHFLKNGGWVCLFQNKSFIAKIPKKNHEIWQIYSIASTFYTKWHYFQVFISIPKFLNNFWKNRDSETACFQRTDFGLEKTKQSSVLLDCANEVTLHYLILLFKIILYYINTLSLSFYVHLKTNPFLKISWLTSFLQVSYLKKCQNVLEMFQISKYFCTIRAKQKFLTNVNRNC